MRGAGMHACASPHPCRPTPHGAHPREETLSRSQRTAYAPLTHPRNVARGDMRSPRPSRAPPIPSRRSSSRRFPSRRSPLNESTNPDTLGGMAVAQAARHRRAVTVPTSLHGHAHPRARTHTHKGGLSRSLPGLPCSPQLDVRPRLRGRSLTRQRTQTSTSKQDGTQYTRPDGAFRWRRNRRGARLRPR